MRSRAGAIAIAMTMSACGYARAQENTGHEWPTAEPAAVGLDAAKLKAFDADISAGEYGLVDSMLVIRCGQQAYTQSYSHDYGKIYGELAKQEGPLNHDVHGPYNYYSAEFHPYYKHSDLHTMQSVSKTVTSVTIGAAMLRGDFKAELDAPVLPYFSEYKISNLDERKRRITLRNLLTMTAGFQWNEDTAYNDPKNSCDIMESKHDWVEYVLNQPMAAEPGKVWVYNSGVTQLLSHIFKKVTGKTVDDYAAEHVFKPLGMRYEWKHSPTGLPDTEGGLYISAEDLAKIGYLYLNNGKWNGTQIVSPEWAKQSLKSGLKIRDEGESWNYGFQWWLQPWGKSKEHFAWAARGFGGQDLRVVPEYNLIAVFTGWSIIPETEGKQRDRLERVIAAVNSAQSCEATTK
jgi:CubicO group peptidase (beta-lactamase class C family)